MEQGGVHLLKRGKRGLVRVLFSRTGFICLILLLNGAMMVGFHLWLRELLPAVLLPILRTAFVAGMVLYLLNSSMDPSSKLTWFILIAVAPLLGASLCLYVRTDWGQRKLKQRLRQRLEESQAALPKTEESLLQPGQGGGLVCLSGPRFKSCLSLTAAG